MAQDYLDAFPDLHIELISLYVDGSTVLQEWRTTGTHSGELMGIPATGRRAETIGAGVDRFGEDGLVDTKLSSGYWRPANGGYRNRVVASGCPLQRPRRVFTGLISTGTDGKSYIPRPVNA
jgi:hypothetical protein